MFRVEIKRIPRNEAGEFVIQPHEYASKWTHYRSLLFLGGFCLVIVCMVCSVQCTVLAYFFDFVFIEHTFHESNQTGKNSLFFHTSKMREREK